MESNEHTFQDAGGPPYKTVVFSGELYQQKKKKRNGNKEKERVTCLPYLAKT